VRSFEKEKKDNYQEPLVLPLPLVAYCGTIYYIHIGYNVLDNITFDDFFIKMLIKKIYTRLELYENYLRCQDYFCQVGFKSYPK